MKAALIRCILVNRFFTRPEIRGELFESIYTWSGSCSIRHLFQGAVRNARAGCYCRPRTLTALEVVQNILVDGVHILNYKPELGRGQAVLGLNYRLKFGAVTKVLDPKLKSAVDELLDIVADNLRAQMGRTSVTALARASRVSKGSIQRILGGSKGYAGQAKSAAQIDTLLRLAWHFQIPLQSFFTRQPDDRTAVVLGRYQSPHSPHPASLNRR